METRDTGGEIGDSRCDPAIPGIIGQHITFPDLKNVPQFNDKAELFIGCQINGMWSFVSSFKERWMEWSGKGKFMTAATNTSATVSLKSDDTATTSTLPIFNPEHTKQ